MHKPRKLAWTEKTWAKMATEDKILTTTALTNRMFLDVGGDMIEVAHAQATHKYLGTKFPGDFSTRVTVDVKNMFLT